MTTKCPRCGRPLSQVGEATVDGTTTYPVFQCDDCIVQADLGGAQFPAAFTFALDADGRPFDPASPGDPLPDGGQ
jgi:hypothetical protein